MYNFSRINRLDTNRTIVPPTIFGKHIFLEQPLFRTFDSTAHWIIDILHIKSGGAKTEISTNCYSLSWSVKQPWSKRLVNYLYDHTNTTDWVFYPCPCPCPINRVWRTACVLPAVQFHRLNNIYIYIYAASVLICDVLHYMIVYYGRVEYTERTCPVLLNVTTQQLAHNVY